MSRDKQIEEMANDLAQICPDLVENCCGQINCVTHLTLSLSKKGYRKASDVVEDIFSDFESILFSLMYLDFDGKYHLRKMNADRVTKIFERYYNIQNKYTENKGE